MGNLIRVLYLGDCGSLEELSRKTGMCVRVTSLDGSVTYINSRDGCHRVALRGLALARAASAKEYDLVVIGNNKGAGFPYAEAIPGEMRSRTLVVWNRRTPRNLPAYRRLGYQHFCSLTEQTHYMCRMLSGACLTASVAV